MKLAIVGSRSFGDYEGETLLLNHKFTKALEVLQGSFPAGSVTEIVSGGARGADAIGKALAGHLRLKYTEFLPDWAKYGRSAGFKRNALIINHADVVLAFWDGKSRGTKNSIDIAQAQGKKVIIYDYSLDEF